jgi:Holliday junction resolvase RusA-like endonuclease
MNHAPKMAHGPAALGEAGPVTFTVPGEPIGKARARILRSGGAFTPERSAAYERAIKWSAKVAMRGQQPLTGACLVTAAFELSIPRSWSQRKRAQALAGAIAPRGRPDLDNLGKALLDGLNGIVFADDAAVIHLNLKKQYAAAPKTICTVRSAGSTGDWL